MPDPPSESNDHGRLRPSGGYRKLRAFQTTSVIYDGTTFFCEKFIRSHKLADQLIGAARSGRQNIGEGSRASAVSAQSELFLVQVARNSQDELLLDYEDFLRQKKTPTVAHERCGSHGGPQRRQASRRCSFGIRRLRQMAGS